MNIIRGRKKESAEEIEEVLMVREPLLGQQDQQPSSQDDSLPSLLTYLYVGHFLARWGARMWEFSVGLYMISIWPDSLLFAAIYGVVESASTALFGPIVGQWVDRLTYVKVLRLWLAAQNLSFIIAGATVIALVEFSTLKSSNFTAFISLVVLTNISGAVAVLSTLAGTILIEREWVVVISEGRPPEILTNINSIIRRIDLISKLFAPVITGFIISFVSLTASALTLALWNAISVWVEYWLFISVYNGIPALGESSQRRISRLSSSVVGESSSTSQERESLLSNDEGNSALPRKTWLMNIFEWVPWFDAWKVYFQQDVVLPGLALALLYFTVLSFGTLMTAALEWEGVPAFVIGIARGISAMIGIGATFVYPVLQSRISTLRTGLWSIWSQWTFLLVCVASILVHKSLLSAYLLMAGVATSRLGLWTFDLAVIQQMQDHVPESDRCVVGGVQNSLQSTLDLMSYVMGIIISNPKDFWKLILLSFLVSTLAALLYTLYVYLVRKHLFHFEKLFLLIKWLIGSPEDSHSI
ncbi:solute carrier family 40 member 2-like [Juglans microcarpa x Juglans regia]|uniref:solute carrier family 40 member 2-like n=1 Tax=Juglans microcarpa x Juglans regia TaxID=2249226 RepID=UPI001B7E3DDD|nr:solute carrier family 40 member 2-like [Juglans microcarpa x Juglans regia]